MKFSSTEIEKYFFYYPIGILILVIFTFTAPDGFYRIFAIILLTLTSIGLLNEIIKNKRSKNKK